MCRRFWTNLIFTRQSPPQQPPLFVYRLQRSVWVRHRNVPGISHKWPKIGTDVKRGKIFWKPATSHQPPKVVFCSPGRLDTAPRHPHLFFRICWYFGGAPLRQFCKPSLSLRNPFYNSESTESWAYEIILIILSLRNLFDNFEPKKSLW